MTILNAQQVEAFRAAAAAKWLEALPTQGGDAVETWNFLTDEWNNGDPLTPLMATAGISELIPPGFEEMAYNEQLGQELWDVLGDEWGAYLDA